VGVQLDSEKPDGTVHSAHRLFEAPGGSILSMDDIEAWPLSSKAAPRAAAAATSAPVTKTRQVTKFNFFKHAVLELLLLTCMTRQSTLICV
jgi:hypothetical protein